MNRRLILPIALAALFLGACEETPTETAQDVSEARQEASKDVAAARADADEEKTEAEKVLAKAQQEHSEVVGESHKELSAAEAEAMAKTAEADYIVALAEADGLYKIEMEKCDALTGPDKDACASRAIADLTTTKANALVRRDEVLAQAAHHDGD